MTARPIDPEVDLIVGQSTSSGEIRHCPPPPELATGCSRTVTEVPDGEDRRYPSKAGHGISIADEEASAAGHWALGPGAPRNARRGHPTTTPGEMPPIRRIPEIIAIHRRAPLSASRSLRVQVTQESNLGSVVDQLVEDVQDPRHPGVIGVGTADRSDLLPQVGVGDFH